MVFMEIKNTNTFICLRYIYFKYEKKLCVLTMDSDVSYCSKHYS